MGKNSDCHHSLAIGDHQFSCVVVDFPYQLLKLTRFKFQGKSNFCASSPASPDLNATSNHKKALKGPK